MTDTSVLIIDDEPLMRLSMVDALSAVGYQVQDASNGDQGIEQFRERRFDLVVTDLRMPGSDGLQVVQACKERSPDTEVIVITAHGSVGTAVQAMKLGAYDYLTKPFSMDELLLTVDRATKVVALRQENRALRRELEGKFSFEGIVGKHEGMRQVIEKIKLVATTDAEKAERGKKFLQMPYIGIVPDETMPWSRSVAPRCRKRFLKRNYLGMKRAPSLER